MRLYGLLLQDEHLTEQCWVMLSLKKKTLSINWGILKEDEMALIKNKLIAGFFPITFHDDGQDITITSYRGTLSKEVLGDIGDGNYYYRSASVSIIQQ